MGLFNSANLFIFYKILIIYLFKQQIEMGAEKYLLIREQSYADGDKKELV